MFSALENVGDVTHAVQLALTPVFLLTGIAGILNVMTNRLARIIDRRRYLIQIDSHADGKLPHHFNDELASLERRRHCAGVAISMCVLSALLVCSVVSVLFLEALLQLNLKWLIGTLFMAATLALVIGLAFFLREVRLATRLLQISPPELNK
jgi:hypothetical protein